MMTVTLWVTGLVNTLASINDSCPWDLIGVYDSESSAIAACVNTDYFVAPVAMNQTMPAGSVWPGLYYPMAAPQAPIV
jgi:hypothetical protein